MLRSVALAFTSFLLLATTSAHADDAWDDQRRDAPSEGDRDTSVWEKRRLALGSSVPYLGFAIGHAFEL